MTNNSPDQPSREFRVIDLDRIIQRGEALPPGVELFWQNPEAPRVATARTDFDYLDGQWLDGRSTPDVEKLAPEALYRFTDVDLNFDGGIRLRDGRLIRSSILGAKVGSWKTPGTHFEAGIIREPIVSFAQRAIGFGHWFLHRLSRLATATIQVPERRLAMGTLFWNPEFIWDSFGRNPDDALQLGKDTLAYWRVHDVLVPTYSTPLAFPRVTDAARMRRDVAHFTRGIGGSRGDGFGPEKVFLMRTPASSVRTGVSDPDTLRTTFERRGFTSVDISTLSFPDQVRLIRSAHVVAGEVGSFSMNAIFAEPGLGVITVAANSVNDGQPYKPGNKTFTRAVTDAFEHHQRRIIASENLRTNSWVVDFDVLNAALDSLPDIP